MCTSSVSGVILSVVTINDFDAQVTVFTRPFGKLVLVARRLNRPGSLRGSLLTFSRCCFQIRHAPSSRVLTIEECERLETSHQLSSDYLRFLCASYVAELMLLAVPQRETCPEVYDLLKPAFDTLGSAKGPEAVALAVDSKLLQMLGYSPSVSRCVECGKPTKVGPGLFHVERGGLVCPNCLDKEDRGEESRTVIKVSAGAIAFVQSARAKPIESFRSARVSRALGRELLRLLSLHKEYHLQIRLNSARLLTDHLRPTSVR